MAAIYEHKSRGLQIKWKLHMPDGSCSNKYRYVHTRAVAEQVRRDCEFLESGSRAGNLSTREIAQARRDGLLTELEARTLSGGKVVVEYNLKKVLEAYRTTISISNTPVAFEKAFSKATLIALWLKRYPIPLLTDSDIKAYVVGRKDGKITYKNKKTGFIRVGARPKTIANEIQILRGIIDEAMKLGMVESNPARLVAVPVKSSRLLRALSLQEIDKVLETAVVNRHLMHGQLLEFIHVALFTGFRRSELRTLTWDDINFDTRRIVIQSKPIDGEPDFTPKSGTARFKSIPDKIMPLLQAMERRGRFVFGGDKPYHVDSISQVTRLLMRRAGLIGVSLHHCRHTYGSWLLRKTGDLSFVQGEMGHLDISTTKKYMHTIEDTNDPARSFDYE